MLDYYSNQYWNSSSWDEIFRNLDMMKGTVREKFKDHPLFSVQNLYTNFAFTELTATALNRMLYALCGKRLVAPIVSDINEDLTSESVTELANIIVATFKEKWDRQKAVYEIEYDPIHNYSETYSEITTGSQVDDIDVAKSKSNSLAKSGSDTTTVTYNLSNTDTIDQDESESSNGADGVYGFNSPASVGRDTNTDSSTRALDSSRSSSKTGTETSQFAQGTSHTGSESGTEAFDARTTSSGTKDYSKSGNIGNIKTQELIEAEIRLWRWNILSEMMDDIKSFITIPIYG